MNGIKEVLNKHITIKRIGKHGKFVILNTSISNLEKELIKQSEQLFCGTCNKFEVCKDLCKETDLCCKIYKAK